MLSIPVIAMASISFYVAFYHLLIYLRRRQFREHLTFFLLCLSVVLYDAFCVGLYNANSVIEGVQWQRMQFIALALFVPAFLWFVATYTNQKPGYIFRACLLFYLIALFVQLTDRSDLTFLTGQPSVKHVTLAGFGITYHEVTLGTFSSVQSMVGLVASIYILVMVFRYYKSGHKREAMPLILATGLMYAASFHDTLVGNSVYSFIYLMEYAYLATILMMTSALSRTVVEAAIAKEELRKSEEWFRSLVETTSDWVWEVDTQARYTYASPRIRDLLGYEPEEMLGRTPFDFMDPKEVQGITRNFQSIVQNGGVLERMENTNIHKNGQTVVLETSAIPFFSENGELLGYRGIDRDITERKKAEKALKESEEKFRSIVENSLTGIFKLDNSYHFVYANNELCQILGYPQEQLVGLDFRRVISDHSQEFVADRYIRRQRGEDVPARYELEIVRLNGETRDAEMIVNVVKDASGVPSTMGQLIDITERKQTEAEREALIQELEAKNAELERFTYTVSHDLKSPLVTIKGFVGFLKQDFISKNQDRFFSDAERIENATVKMDLLLRDLLELSRVGRLINPSEEIPFEYLVREATDMVQGQLDAGGVTVRITGRDLPVVYGDRRRLVEVLQNLLDNAAKFMGDQPDPYIEIGQHDSDGKNPVFFVKDNGIGFSSEYREHVFGLFNKLDPKTEGSGIGLALVKRIIEIHGGRIWVESEKGKGSTFYFTLAGNNPGPR